VEVVGVVTASVARLFAVIFGERGLVDLAKARASAGCQRGVTER